MSASPLPTDGRPAPRRHPWRRWAVLALLVAAGTVAVLVVLSLELAWLSGPGPGPAVPRSRSVAFDLYMVDSATKKPIPHARVGLFYENGNINEVVRPIGISDEKGYYRVTQTFPATVVRGADGIDRGRVQLGENNLLGAGTEMVVVSADGYRETSLPFWVIGGETIRYEDRKPRTYVFELAPLAPPAEGP